MSNAEQIAIEALRSIVHSLSITKETAGSTSGAPALDIALKAIEQIAELQKPTVHNLSAADCIIDKPPGGGA
jgi:hypothetical protein